MRRASGLGAVLTPQIICRKYGRLQAVDSGGVRPPDVADALGSGTAARAQPLGRQDCSAASGDGVAHERARHARRSGADEDHCWLQDRGSSHGAGRVPPVGQRRYIRCNGQARAGRRPVPSRDPRCSYAQQGERDRARGFCRRGRRQPRQRLRLRGRLRPGVSRCSTSVASRQISKTSSAPR